MNIFKPNYPTHPKTDLTMLTHAELLDLKYQLDSKMAEIKQQLDQARINRFRTGQYADATWYMRATHALRCKGLEAQAVQNELSRRKQERKSANANTLESRFIKIARIRLADDVFADILSEAGELAATRNEAEPS